MTQAVDTAAAVGGRLECIRCGIELAPHALACPACRSLVHAESLQRLSASAGELEKHGDAAAAREVWMRSLELLPAQSRQYELVRERIRNLDEQLGEARGSGSSVDWKKGSWLALVASAVLFLAGKGKFLLLGLTKLKTFASMFAFFGLYWTAFGWPLALGLALSIYVHEMGHVAMLRRLGIGAGDPLFIPGVGAMVMLREPVTDPRKDAAIGLAGPVWGLGAGLAALLAYQVTDVPIWLAIAQLTGLINLFNLIPVWQLDGARGFSALSATERWGLLAVLGAVWWLTGQGLLLLVGAVMLWRVFQAPEGPGDSGTLARFAVLLGALGWLSALSVV